MKTCLVFVILFCSLHFASAQTDSTVWLKEIPVSGKRIQTSAIHHREDTLNAVNAIKLKSVSLAGQLENETAVFIKSYGPGSMASISVRGTGASQTNVNWNGIPLQSPMLGQYDLNLIPVYLIDNASVRTDATATDISGLPAGGNIQLNSNADLNNGVAVELFTGAGSFGHYQLGAGVEAGNKLWSSKTRIYHQQAVNDFMFTDAELKRRQLTNSSYLQEGISQDIKVGTEANYFEAHAWYLANELHVPPLMVSNSSRQKQLDEGVRLVAAWNGTTARIKYYIRTGYKQDYLRYINRDVQLDEISNADADLYDAGLNYMINDSCSVGVQGSYMNQDASSDGYKYGASSELYSFTLKSKYLLGKFSGEGIILQQWFNGTALPLQPAVSAAVRLNTHFVIRADAGYTFRNPTLNDLYWQPGGNLNLKAEHGYKSSAGIRYSIMTNNFSVHAEPGIFYINVKQLLSWRPDETGLYRAINYSSVVSKGIEGKINLKWNSRKLIVEGSAHIQYNDAVAVNESDNKDQSGQQLPYTPRWLFRSDLSLTYLSVGLKYSTGYTGYRYVTTDHSQFLEPFYESDFTITADKKIRGSGITFFASVKNCWNAEYQVIAWRAMPGRYYEAGLLIKTNY